MSKKSKKKKKVHNWHALNAILRKAGVRPDNKKEESKMACRSLRQKIKDWLDL